MTTAEQILNGPKAWLPTVKSQTPAELRAIIKTLQSQFNTNPRARMLLNCCKLELIVHEITRKERQDQHSPDLHIRQQAVRALALNRLWKQGKGGDLR